METDGSDISRLGQARGSSACIIIKDGVKSSLSKACHGYQEVTCLLYPVDTYLHTLWNTG